MPFPIQRHPHAKSAFGKLALLSFVRLPVHCGEERVEIDAIKVGHDRVVSYQSDPKPFDVDPMLEVLHIQGPAALYVQSGVDPLYDRKQNDGFAQNP
jgi:hypothetical protein